MKQQLRQQFLGAFADLYLLDFTLNEAESVAWSTPFPHLFFPALAEEKIGKALAWAKHQRQVKARAAEISFAA